VVRRRNAIGFGLALLAVSAVLMIYGAQEVLSPTPAIDRAAEVLESDSAHGYEDDAERLATTPDWLARYPELLPTFHMHPSTKGPGIILTYHLMARVIGHGRDLAIAIAVTLALVSAAAVPAVYLLVRTLGGTNAAGFAGASLYALAPSLGGFWPSFDAAYPLGTSLLVSTWHLALVRRSWRLAVLSGVLMAGLTLFAYNLAVLGAFLLFDTYLVLRPRADRWLAGARCAFLASMAFVAFYGLVYMTTRFDPLATFAAAYDNQRVLLETIPRPYPATALFDLTDLAFGLGWIPVIPAIVGTAGAVIKRSSAQSGNRHAGTCVACLGQVLVVTSLALLPGESARVLLFLFPFVVVPAAIEVARWRARSQHLLMACTFLVSLAVTRSVTFVVA
jgi:hypothetical protein